MKTKCKFLFVILITLVTLVSCKVCEPTIQTQYRDSIVTNYHRDSVYLYEKDSIFIREKGDTILIEMWSIRYKDKLVEVRDTTIVNREVTLVNEVRYIPTLYKYALWFSIGVILLFIIRIVIKLYGR